MEVCCGTCHIELNPQDEVVLDDVGTLRHKKCYDFANGLHLINTVGTYESVKGRFPDYLMNVYREVIAMGEDETRSPEEITDEEVIAVLCNMFTEND